MFGVILFTASWRLARRALEGAREMKLKVIYITFMAVSLFGYMIACSEATPDYGPLTVLITAVAGLGLGEIISKHIKLPR